MKRKAKVFRPTVFAFPYLAVTLVFVIVPLLLILVYAFRGQDGYFSLENFRLIFCGDGVNDAKDFLVRPLLKTLSIAAVSTAICLLIAYPVAYVLSSQPFRKMTVIALLFVVPMWINFMLRIFALKSILVTLGMENGYWMAVIGMVYDFFPYMLLPIYTVLANMDKSYVEASRDLGANPVRTFCKVTLPLSLPGIISGISMMFMPIFSSYAITGTMGDNHTSVIGSEIYSAFHYYEYGHGAALSFVLLIIVLFVVWLGNFLTRRSQKAPKGGKA